VKPTVGEPSNTSGDGSAAPVRRPGRKAAATPAVPAPAPSSTAAPVPPTAAATPLRKARATAVRSRAAAPDAPPDPPPTTTTPTPTTTTSAGRPKASAAAPARRKRRVEATRPGVAATAAAAPALPPATDASAVDAPLSVSLAERAASLRAVDRLDDARAIDAQIRAAFGSKATARARAMALADAAETELLAGDLAAARSLTDEALAVAPSPAAGPDDGRMRAGILQARLEVLQGRLADGRAAAAAGVTAAEGAGDGATAAAWLAVLGLAELLAGDPSVAAVHFTTARDAALERGETEPSRTRVDADLVEALVAAGRLDEAQAALDAFRARAAGARTPWVIAADARCEALVRTARGEPEAAQGALRAAAATIESLPLLLERARCLLAWGVTLRAAGRLNASHAALTTAREAFAALPSPPWEARAVAELARLRKRPAAAS